MAPVSGAMIPAVVVGGWIPISGLTHPPAEPTHLVHMADMGFCPRALFFPAGEDSTPSYILLPVFTRICLPL
jgi:hypothetical protein